MIRDVSKGLIDLLNAQLGNYLSEVDYVRNDNTPEPKNITSGSTKNMYPEIFVDVNELEFVYRTLASKPNLIYTAEITIFIKTNEKDSLSNWCSNYIEAIYNMLEENNIGDEINKYIERANIVDINTKDSTYMKAVGIIIKIEEQGE